MCTKLSRFVSVSCFSETLSVEKFLSRLDLSPNNLTKSEDWVWLRLTDYEKFSKNEIKGSARWNENFPEPLKISQTENSDMHHVMEMIKELAIYENMLDQFWGLKL